MTKWIFDRLMALFGILSLWWLMLIVAICIKVKMSGPVFFRHQRVGRGGQLFTLVKFRTMLVNHDGNSVSVAGESRITPLGATLRRWKLDELPELWNVLVGDMSFVGPRPDVPGYADVLTGEARDILSLRPGITGPASMKYRNEEEILSAVENPQQYNDEVIFPDKVRINLLYLHDHSFFLDLKMIVATVLGRRILYHGEWI